MITYRCDRCGSETTPERLYEVVVTFTPHRLSGDGGLDSDRQDCKTFGHACADCTDRIEPLMQALVTPPDDDRSTLATELGWPQDAAGLILMARDWPLPLSDGGDMFSGDVLIKKLGHALEAATSADAVDPSASNSGTPSTRDISSSLI